ncbi:glutamate/aspartate ABC transporter substrate-binding protein [Pseudomonas tolaasii]|uniref:glutamate/aspartate ABC transporter substrate-binding protein n=1 Tax=Pseudomonas tolaasii TaxID=29442 RepID=UPI0015A1DB92|nr:glutamate/aspartate ABC transporter substrate-binding protein [Pseudomonas tolaasii]NVZ48486.1 glutamate/aspartate ABC transporter substrate-binding protein [Pseudomonas tolaasii]NWA48143.1 glutamate/aspartate ABC transporter substrate-binding protein [Pseudomonas tolaasii]
MRTLRILFSAAIATALINTPLVAAELTGTLKKIKESGTITIGQRDSSIPFSYFADASGRSIGYSQDIQLTIVEAIKKALDAPDLKVKYNLITSQNRIPLIQNGTVDLECGSTTHNAERAQQVDFSVGIFETNTRLLSNKDSPYKDFADLKGKNVVTTAGTTSERILRAMNADKQMGMNIISGKDVGESFQMLEGGRAVAFMLDDALLAGEMAKARNPAEWAVTGTAQSQDIYGCMMRKGDARFKKVVDETIKGIFSSGDIVGIYDKWFNQPIPPKGLNLSFPMSAQFKAMIANPDDKPAPPPGI